MHPVRFTREFIESPTRFPSTLVLTVQKYWGDAHSLAIFDFEVSDKRYSNSLRVRWWLRMLASHLPDDPEFVKSHVLFFKRHILEQFPVDAACFHLLSRILVGALLVNEATLAREIIQLSGSTFSWASLDTDVDSWAVKLLSHSELQFLFRSTHFLPDVFALTANDASHHLKQQVYLHMQPQIVAHLPKILRLAAWGGGVHRPFGSWNLLSRRPPCSEK